MSELLVPLSEDLAEQISKLAAIAGVDPTLIAEAAVAEGCFTFFSESARIAKVRAWHERNLDVRIQREDVLEAVRSTSRYSISKPLDEAT